MRSNRYILLAAFALAGLVACGGDDGGGDDALCGNGRLDPGEACDGAALGGETCESRGFDDGTLGCTASCTFETSACVNYSCGDGEANGKDVCDGDDLAGQTCQTLGFDEGTLGCEANCGAFDTSGCVQYVCGDGSINTDEEECDGDDLGGLGCGDVGYDSGDLGCKACSFDVTTCYTCGDAIQDPTELCDDGNTADGDCCSSGCVIEAGCELEPNDTVEQANGFDDLALDGRIGAFVSPAGDVDVFSVVVPAGHLGHLTAEVVAGPAGTACGSSGNPDGVDSQLRVRDAAAASLGFNDDISGSTNWCSRVALTNLPAGTYYLETRSSEQFSPDLTYDYTLAVTLVVVELDVCGNGLLEDGEACDGTALGGETCATQGFGTGTLACTDQCAFDTSACLAPYCGDGVRDEGEACDDGNDQPGDGCDADCAVEAGHYFEVEPNHAGTAQPGGGTAGNNFGSANANGPFSEGVIVHAAISPVGDEDVFAITNPTGVARPVRLDTYSAALGLDVPCGTTIDTYLYVRTAQGTSLAANDDRDGSIDRCSGLTYMLPPGETVYAHVLDFNDNDAIPGYLLRVGFPAVCGDGVVEGAEACDDGNGIDGDGCDNNCTVTACGNGVITSGEDCDGSQLGGETCASQGFGTGALACTEQCTFDTGACAAPFCGDGVVTGPETCDDGNDAAGDGCDADCQLEPGHFFEVEPNDDGTPQTGGGATTGNDFSSANANGPFSASVIVHGSLSPVGDEDVFAVTNPLETSVTVRFDVYNAALGLGVSCGTNTIDTVLNIRNAGGTQLAQNIDRVSGSDYCSGLAYTIPAGGTVYAHLLEYGDNNVVPGYLLRIDFLP